jgi:diacylglycerol O-acyltransferase
MSRALRLGLCHDEPMTDRLSATDAAFLYAEDASTPMHVGGVVILEPEPGTFEYQQFVDLISTRLSLVPRYRQRVRLVPGRLARPVWVDDEDFDLMYHVRRSALPKPGTKTQLEDLVGRLISRPLDRNRPLWELYVIEGLENGRVALVNKTHHAMVDRIGAVDVAAAILDLSKRPRTLPEQPWIPMPAPSDVDLIVDAIADISSRPSDLLDVARLAAADVGSTVARVAHFGREVVELLRRAINPVPRSLLNVRISGQRRFATFRVDLADVKAISSEHCTSVNDVILAVITAALRTWLLSRGEAVTATTTLRALVPMSVRATSSVDGGSDQGSLPVVSYVVDLPVAEPNPACARPIRATDSARTRGQGGRRIVRPLVQRADHQRARPAGAAVRRRLAGGCDVPGCTLDERTGVGGGLHLLPRLGVLRTDR